MLEHFIGFGNFIEYFTAIIANAGVFRFNSLGDPSNLIDSLDGWEDFMYEPESLILGEHRQDVADHALGP